MFIFYNFYLVIVFINIKKMVDEVVDDLLFKGLKVGRIYGDLFFCDCKKMMK